MHIQKVLNSSVVLVQDDSGEESILLGKGIGYGRKAGEPIERQPSDRVFLPLSNPDAQPMLELFSSIPAVYLDLTQDIVDDAEQSLGVKLLNSTTGGKHGGGASLTPEGETLLDAYDSYCSKLRAYAQELFDETFDKIL